MDGEERRRGVSQVGTIDFRKRKKLVGYIRYSLNTTLFLTSVIATSVPQANQEFEDLEYPILNLSDTRNRYCTRDEGTKTLREERGE